MGKRKKPADETPQDNLGDDSFGLPDIEYKPLDQAEETVHAEAADLTHAEEEVPAGAEEPQAEPAIEYAGEEAAPLANENPEGVQEDQPAVDRPDKEFAHVEPPKSNAPVIIGLVIVFVLLVAGGLIYWFVYKLPADRERAKQQKEQRDKDALAKQREEENRLARERAEEEKRKALEAAKPKVGTVETLTDRTRRYYVVVTSAVDGDLINDFAQKLSAKGISSKIIPPFGGMKFHRLSIADFDTFAAAQANADQAKAEYGQGVWVIRY